MFHLRLWIEQKLGFIVVKYRRIRYIIQNIRFQMRQFAVLNWFLYYIQKITHKKPQHFCVVFPGAIINLPGIVQNIKILYKLFRFCLYLSTFYSVNNNNIMVVFIFFIQSLLLLFFLDTPCDFGWGVVKEYTTKYEISEAIITDMSFQYWSQHLPISRPAST